MKYNTLGIDFGDVYTYTAYPNDKGAVTMVDPNKGGGIPTYTYVNEKKKATVGSKAREYKETGNEQVACNIRSSLGKRDQQGNPVIYTNPGGSFIPEAMAALVLRQAVAQANARLKPISPFKNLVVTVPATFSNAQFKAMRDAVEIAGLNLKGMLSQSAAAALYFKKYMSKDTEGDFLVCVLDQSNFDTAVFRVEKDKFQVIAAGGLQGAGSGNIDLLRDSEAVKTQADKLYYRMEAVIRRTIKASGLDDSQLKYVYLVGDVESLPYIKKSLEESFGHKVATCSMPETAVARGAAEWSRLLQEGCQGYVTDVVSHGLGLKSRTGDGQDFNNIVINRNAALPAMGIRDYLLPDSANTVEFKVTEGDYRELTDVSFIGEGAQRVPKGLDKVRDFKLKMVQYADRRIKLFVNYKGLDQGDIEIPLKEFSGLSQEEIEKWRGILAGLQLEGDAAGNALQRMAVSVCKPAHNSNVKAADCGTAINCSLADKSLPEAVNTVMADVVGMNALREGIRDYRSRHELRSRKARKGFLMNEDHCVAILGQSGMGCTLAASKAAECISKMGLVGGRDPVWARRADIVKADENATKSAIQSLFQSAMDGILIIDDFHEFIEPGPGYQSMMALDLVYKAYIEASRRVLIIVAGETEGIEKIFKKDSRVEKLFESHTIRLEGYTPQEYVTIIHRMAAEQGFEVDSGADAALAKHIKGMSCLPDFDHIYYVEELLDRAKTDVANKAMGKRHVKDDDFTLITLDNFKLTGDEQTFEELMQELDSLTGLTSVKGRVKELIADAQVRQRAKEEGRELPDDAGSLHMVFTGNAGTGKTVVARLISQIYRELGVLSRGQMVEVTRKDLVSEFVGKTAKQVDEKVREALGGVLFIDEAYSLCRGENDSFGQEAVDALVPLIENNRDNLVVILAGYTGDMKKFMTRNQGLSSRFPTEISFPDYKLDELMSIFAVNLKKGGYIITPDAEAAVRELVSREMRTSNFGNGRSIRNIYEQIVKRQRSRLASLKDWGDREHLTIRKQDVVDQTESKSGETIEDIIAELNAMTGLESVKKEINSLVNTARVNAFKKARGMDTSNAGTLHMVFTGNPGTGKTTVARMLGRIYKQLGLLATDNVVEVKRNDLVAGYVGQTATKVVDQLNRADGGILFIDEAYQLNSGGERDFGREAIETLVAELENRRDSFMCIIAGYTDEIQDFLRTNPGLNSRFPNRINFEDYTVPEMADIFVSMAASQGFKLDKGVREKVEVKLERLSASKDFANGRGTRNYFDQVKKNLNNRMAQELSQGREPDNADLITIRLQDIA